MTPSSSGGSNATDFQPTTRNPQGNVGGGLQPTTSDQSNVFNQPGINPQAFPKTNSLRVISNGTQVQATPASQPDTTPPSWGALTLFFIAIVAVVVVLVVIIKAAKPSDKQPEEHPEQVEVPEVMPKPAKSKKKSKNKKKNNRKKRQH